jgi:hypothetical protein
MHPSKFPTAPRRGNLPPREPVGQGANLGYRLHRRLRQLKAIRVRERTVKLAKTALKVEGRNQRSHVKSGPTARS